MSYLYPVLNLSNNEYQNWIKENKEKIEKEGHKFVEDLSGGLYQDTNAHLLKEIKNGG